MCLRCSRRFCSMFAPCNHVVAILPSVFCPFNPFFLLQPACCAQSATHTDPNTPPLLRCSLPHSAWRVCLPQCIQYVRLRKPRPTVNRCSRQYPQHHRLLVRITLYAVHVLFLLVTNVHTCIVRTHWTCLRGVASCSLRFVPIACTRPRNKRHPFCVYYSLLV